MVYYCRNVKALNTVEYRCCSLLIFAEVHYVVLECVAVDCAVFEAVSIAVDCVD